MFLYFCAFLLAVVSTEALTEIVVKSTLFRPIREKIEVRAPRLSKLITCPYCFSVWASIVFTTCVFFVVGGGVSLILLPLTILVVHRCSNYLHMLVDRYFDKFYSGGKS